MEWGRGREEKALTSEAAVFSQVGGVLLYGSVDDEIPFLRHGATQPPLAHRFTRLEAIAPIATSTRAGGLPATVHTPHGGVGVFGSGDRELALAAAAAAARMGKRRECEKRGTDGVRVLDPIQLI